MLNDLEMIAFENLGGRLLSIGSEGCDVKTLDTSYRDWMTAAGANYAIIRPDFYIAATASTPAQLAIHFNTILDRLRLIT